MFNSFSFKIYNSFCSKSFNSNSRSNSGIEWINANSLLVDLSLLLGVFRQWCVTYDELSMWDHLMVFVAGRTTVWGGVWHHRQRSWRQWQSGGTGYVTAWGSWPIYHKNGSTKYGLFRHSVIYLIDMLVTKHWNVWPRSYYVAIMM